MSAGDKSEILYQHQGARASHLLGIHTVACNLIAIAEACLAGAIGYFTLHVLVPKPQLGNVLALVSAIAVASIVSLSAALAGAADYDGFASRRSLLPSALAAGGFVSLVAIICGGSPAPVLLSGITMFSAVYILRIAGVASLFLIGRSGKLKRRLAIISNDAIELSKMKGILSTRHDIQFVYSGTAAELPVLRGLASNNNLDEIILVGPHTGRGQLTALAGLSVTLVRANLDDDLFGLLRSSTKKPISAWNVPVTIVARPPLRGWYMVAKRAIDLTGASLAAILFLPLMVFCAMAVRLESSGPTFFVQKRTGFRGRTFNMIKFRSMYSDKADHNGAQLTSRNGDARVTRVGAILRRTSLDELPQLLNVFRGDMSLVGPRPHPAGAKAGDVLYDTLIPEFYTRYTMLPGITGLAQVSGHRGNTETKEQLFARYNADLEYAARWSPVDDIVIICRTVLHLLNPKNAF